MKTKVLFSLLVILMFSLGTTEAQVKVDVKKKVNKQANLRANKKSDELIDKGFDKLEEGIGNLFKKKKEKQEGQNRKSYN